MWRIRRSRDLADRVARSFPPNAPLVSVIVPARDERRNIERVRALGTRRDDTASIEVVVVDDRSTDGTGDVVRSDGRRRCARVRRVENPELPERVVRQTVGVRDRRAMRHAARSSASPTPTPATVPDLVARAVNAHERDVISTCCPSPVTRSSAASGNASSSRTCSG